MSIKSLKELPKEEFFASGHRMCAGCGPATCVRQTLIAAGRPVIMVSATGCVEVSTTIYPYTSWKIPWIHIAFENAAAVASGIEAALKKLSKDGKAKKYDVIAFAGDGGTFDIGLQALSGAIERGHDFLYICYDNEAYMNCLPGDSFIMTVNGLKKVEEVKVGEQVYAYDMTTGNLVQRKCIGVFNNGIRDVFEVETLHHLIRATPNHPFLIVKNNGRGKERKLIWKTLSQLRIGDKIVVLKNLNGEGSCKFSFTPIRKGEYKINRLNNIKLPKQSNADLLRYLGLFLGDGWIRVKKGEVGFAIPKGPERKILLELHTKLFGNNGISNDDNENYVYFYSVNLARFINSLGFGNGAKNKTIPSWIFTLPNEEKEAFIDGLLLSDGYKYGNSFRYVSSSFELLKRLKLLLQTMNYRVGKIHWQIVKKGKKFPRRILLKDTAFGYICFSRRKRWNIQKYRNQYRYQDPLIENEYFGTEIVRNINYIGKMQTFDLRVESDHNFIADGVVVHNTGIQRSGATPHGAETTTSPAGSVIPGKKEYKKRLTDIIIAHDPAYAATASIAYWKDYMNKVIKGLDAKGPAFIHVFAPCPRGWRFPSNQTINIAKLAVETRYFPLYEYENGKYTLSLDIPKPKPIEEFIKPQRRFRHLLDPKNKNVLEELKIDIERNWERIKKLCSL